MLVVFLQRVHEAHLKKPRDIIYTGTQQGSPCYEYTLYYVHMRRHIQEEQWPYNHRETNV